MTERAYGDAEESRRIVGVAYVPSCGVAQSAPTNYDSRMAEAAVTGLLKGTTITLDALVPPLDGQRVRVVISSADESSTLSRDDQVRFDGFVSPRLTNDDLY